MKINILFLLFQFCFHGYSIAQISSNISTVDTELNEDFSGYDLLETKDQIYILAEHWHNIKSVPRATLKILKYLHQEANVRILAIEQGASAAHMINNYLLFGDTVVLRQIARNTMFWGKENWEMFKNLRAFNQTLQPDERIEVKSIDIEYKMESAIFVINELIGNKNIPESLQKTLGAFKQLFDETRSHREQYQGIAVMYYYDKRLVENLVLTTIGEMEEKSEEYTQFFGENFIQFAEIILDMDDGLTFDYTNPNNKYKFRDRLIYQKFTNLIESNPDKGVLCVIGMRHATRRSSIHKLDNLKSSPAYANVSIIRISALLNKLITSSDLRRFNFNYPNQLKKNAATLIKHTKEDAALRSSKGFDYTFFINSSGSLTPFEKVYKETR